MLLVDFMTMIKRESRYGGSPVQTNDAPTTDILASINVRRKRIWRKADWGWAQENLSFVVTPGVVIYAVTCVSGNAIDRIRNIIPNDPLAIPPVGGRPLRQRTEREFFNEIRGYDPTYQGLPRIYLNLGIVNGFWNIRIWPGPVSTFTMGGSAKGVLNTFLIGDVTGVAPFSPFNTGGIANPPLDWFPDGVIEDVLFEGVMGDVAAIQGDAADAKARDAAFEGKLKLLASEEAEVARDNTPITSPLPRLIHRRRFGRRWSR